MYINYTHMCTCTWNTACYVAGARVDVEDKEGNTALHIAARHGHASVVKTLISFGASVIKLVAVTYTMYIVQCTCTWKIMCIAHRNKYT